MKEKKTEVNSFKPNQFMVEQIKEKPMSKHKFMRRTLTTALMAVIFGLVASFTALVIEPMISGMIYKEEEQPKITFPEDIDEMTPAEMLTEQGGPIDSIDSVQLQQILSNVRLDLDNYKQLYRSLSQFAGNLKRSMVIISSKQSNVDWMENTKESKRQTSGIFIASNVREVYVLTDYDAVKDGTDLQVTLASNEDFSFPATFVASDQTTNMAVLSIEMAKLEEVGISTENITKGYIATDNKRSIIHLVTLGSSNANNLEMTPVVAVGSPMGVIQSVGFGIITASSGHYSAEDVSIRMLQTDIVGSQNAGGFLFNLYGELLGIITTDGNVYDMKEMITAYGISDIKPRLEKLTNYSQVSYVGLFGGNVTTDLHKSLGIPYGAYVQKIALDSPAMMAGIQVGDVIVGFDGCAITSFNEYTYILMQTEPGKTVKVDVMRQVKGEYKTMTLDITVGSTQ